MPSAILRASLPAALAILLLVAPSSRVRADAPTPTPAPTGESAAVGCLPTGDGYLRARLRGALDLDIAWRDTEMQCTGGPRPDGSGLRVSIAGPEQSDGRRVRFVFGIAETPEGQSTRARPTNLTVIFDGERRVYATRGDDRCTTDTLEQQRIGALAGAARTWRVVGRGFCVSPANALGADEGEVLLVTSFDFAGKVSYEDEPAEDATALAAHAPASAPAPTDPALEALEALPRATLTIDSRDGAQSIDAWIAATREQQSRGLMYVRSLDAGRGMLFVHDGERPAGMWMKNTYIPLDMLFIDARGRITKIAARTKPHSLSLIRSGGPVLAVLELAGGEAARRGIRVGDIVRGAPFDN